MIRLTLILLAVTVGASATPTDAPSRVVTLAPHLAELVFAAGAGERLVGVTAYTDYPVAAAALPRIGDAFRVDMERIAVLDPDLILAWQEGTPRPLIERLRELGYAVMVLRTRSVGDVAGGIRRIGERLGTSRAAERAAGEFLREFRSAVAGHEDERPLRVFYQVASRPLYTVNGSHFISEIIRLCGGQNVFSDLDELAPVVSVESVLSRDPQVILAPAGAPDVLERWRAWQSVAAVRAGNLRTVAPDTLARPSPRLVQGAAHICAAIEASRRNLAPAAH